MLLKDELFCSKKLLATFKVDELTALLPDPRTQLEELERMAQSLPEDIGSLNEVAKGAVEPVHLFL